MEKKSKKNPLKICLILFISGLFLYTGTWLYCKHFIWLPHLPEQSKIDYVETIGAYTYYNLKIDEDGYFYRMLVPTFTGFWGGRCSVDAVSVIQLEDMPVNENGETESRRVTERSNLAFTVGCPLNLTGKIKAYHFMINATFPDDDCASVAYFIISPDMELNNKDELSAPELKLYQKSLPEMERICKKFHELFSV